MISSWVQNASARRTRAVLVGLFLFAWLSGGACSHERVEPVTPMDDGVVLAGQKRDVESVEPLQQAAAPDPTVADVPNAPTSPDGQDPALATDRTSALDALRDDPIDDHFGSGGLGLRGTGRGGGGTGEGTIGFGTLGTIGHGAGTGSESGYGAGSGGFGEHRASVPRVQAGGDAEVRGSLPREVINRVVRRHMGEVRVCYELELSQHPDLAGRVTVSFIISSTGTVQTASIANTTLNNPSVEGCVARAVQRWAFPAPDDGEAVVVNYPFVFTSQG